MKKYIIIISLFLCSCVKYRVYNIEDKAIVIISGEESGYKYGDTILHNFKYSNSTREVAQDGRRGALMLSAHINHPDIMDFIKIKRDLSQVTGANISIKISEEFMKAVENDDDYWLRFPCDNKKVIMWDTSWEYNVSRLGEVAEHKTSIVVQTLKFR